MAKVNVQLISLLEEKYFSENNHRQPTNTHTHITNYTVRNIHPQL